MKRRWVAIRVLDRDPHTDEVVRRNERVVPLDHLASHLALEFYYAWREPAARRAVEVVSIGVQVR